MTSQEWKGDGWMAGGAAGMVGASVHDYSGWVAPLHGPDMFYCSLTYKEPLNFCLLCAPILLCDKMKQKPFALRQSGAKAWLMR
eukprot:scaffold57177_cov17-Tisochrysis_lutea.AAC.1